METVKGELAFISLRLDYRNNVTGCLTLLLPCFPGHDGNENKLPSLA